MSSMKRVQLAVLFLVAAALFTGTVAHAKVGENPRTAKLRPPVTSDEPKASGMAKFKGTWWGWNPYTGWVFYGNLSVVCNGLTPGEIYTFRGDAYSASIPADPSGTWSDEGAIYFDGMVYVFRVILHDDGTREAKLVLQGDLRP